MGSSRRGRRSGSSLVKRKRVSPKSPSLSTASSRNARKRSVERTQTALSSKMRAAMKRLHLMSRRERKGRSRPSSTESVRAPRPWETTRASPNRKDMSSSPSKLTRRRVNAKSSPGMSFRIRSPRNLTKSLSTTTWSSRSTQWLRETSSSPKATLTSRACTALCPRSPRKSKAGSSCLTTSSRSLASKSPIHDHLSRSRPTSLIDTFSRASAKTLRPRGLTVLPPSSRMSNSPSLRKKRPRRRLTRTLRHMARLALLIQRTSTRRVPLRTIRHR